MSSKFFNNNSGNTLFDKLKGIAGNMANFDRFLAVVGFFRSSGYFKLRKELNDVEEIKILVGINIEHKPFIILRFMERLMTRESKLEMLMPLE